MKKSGPAAILLIAAAILLQSPSCTKKSARIDDGDLPLSDVAIEKKYLAEGFISPDLFRVVIVATKDSSASELTAIRNRAKNRALVSLERSLIEENIRIDANMKAEILNLVQQSGQLARKDVGHSRYHVYYYNITKNNLKKYLKNISFRK